VQVEALLSLSLSVAAEQSVQGVLDRIVRGLAAQPGVALARIWLLMPGDVCDACFLRAECRDQTQCLHLAASAGAPLNSSEEDWSFLQGYFRRVPLNARKVGVIGATGNPILIEDLAPENDWIARPDWAKREGIRAFAGHPLIFRGNTLGVLALFSRQPLDEQGSVWLRMFADQAAVAITNARAFEDRVRVNEELTNEIAERQRAEEALQQAQAELAHVNRLMTMGELTASIAHEVNQPLSGVVLNGYACLRWLSGDLPNLDEARQAVQRIVRDGMRASDVITRIRALSKKTVIAKKCLDLNEVVREVAALAHGEAQRKLVELHIELGVDLPPVLGDRVQLQQVLLNLVMNGIDAMNAVGDRPRELIIKTQDSDADQVRVAVQDSGTGLDAQNAERVFNAFYTTKPEGMGMGLSISRSIVHNHGGRLWAVLNNGPGTTFHFTVQKYQ
jgi:C4-dicarboxylate-specific signal transduction histidine kinase